MADRAKITLVIIETHRNMFKVLKQNLGSFATIPDDLGLVSSLKEAIGVVDKYRPDIVVCADSFDPEIRRSHHRLLAHVKRTSPRTKVVLYYSYRNEAPRSFDAVIDRMYPEVLKAYVQHLAEA